MRNTSIILFKDIHNAVGHLTPIESMRDVPFHIQRVYYISQVPEGITRGFHAHRKLEQVLICLHGSMKIRLKIPFEEEIVELNSPSQGIYIGPMIWREMFDFSNEAVLLVLASEYYSECDYLRDYSVYESEALKYFE